jgi:hypothetical protein
VAGGLVVMQPAAAAVACDRSATPSTLSSQVSAASAGQTICLGAGDYGMWTGTNKAVTLRAESGVNATMKVDLGSGDTGFTLDGLSGMGGNIRGSANNIVIRNSKFTSTLTVQGSPGANLLVDGGQFDWPASYNGGANAKLFIYSSSPGASSGLTVRNSTFRNGDLDGVHIGGSAGADIIGNVFDNLCSSGSNHTDMLQTEGMVGGRIAGNIFRAGLSCAAQGLTSYDGGTKGVIIEDNVIDVRRPWGIEWFSDNSSIIRHNTVVYYPSSQCNFNATCGQIRISRKAEDSAGTGTQVYDNLTTGVSFSDGSTGTQRNNVSSEKASYVGPLNVWAGFKLAANSPVGLKAASDGLDVGVRTSAGGGGGTSSTSAPATSPTSTSPTSTSPTSTAGGGSSDIPATALWTAPTGVKVGTPVTLDGTRSTGNGQLTCTWTFENNSGSIIWETLTGCKLVKTFKYADTKYVKLTVRDADGDTNSRRLSFPVSAA